MWDGFETIWDKECATPSTQVTVIPIPSYSKMRDGSLTDTEYTITGYPENVTVVGVNDFDLAFEHPDTIYIQNIQDNNNPGFTVHPHFYTDKLKNYTDNLVYIPYSCMPEIDPGYEYLQKNYMPILAPDSILNVDNIIVQSENMKRVYLRLLDIKCESPKKWEPRISYEDYPRKQILKKYSRETIPFPISWDRHLWDSNDYQKDTILLVTSAMGVLEFGKETFKRTREIFEDNISKKDSTVIIWRPHKNLPEVISKLRPELFNDFKSLLEFFILNDIGIFDETPSPTPAIIMSDYYMGNECGIKELFKSTGKPILD
jgi:hypothetical protein